MNGDGDQRGSAGPIGAARCGGGPPVALDSPCLLYHQGTHQALRHERGALYRVPDPPDDHWIEVRGLREEQPHAILRRRRQVRRSSGRLSRPIAHGRSGAGAEKAVEAGDVVLVRNDPCDVAGSSCSRRPAIARWSRTCGGRRAKEHSDVDDVRGVTCDRGYARPHRCLGTSVTLGAKAVKMWLFLVHRPGSPARSFVIFEAGEHGGAPVNFGSGLALSPDLRSAQPHDASATEDQPDPQLPRPDRRFPRGLRNSCSANEEQVQHRRLWRGSPAVWQPIDPEDEVR